MAKPQDHPHADNETSLIFDAECPVCSIYSRNVTGCDGAEIKRINARGDHALVSDATARGFDLDEGMVVLHKGQHYHGADALHILAKLAPAKGFRNILNKLLFGSRTVSRLAYPVLRTCRNTLLLLLGRTRIRNLDGGPRSPE